MTLPLFVSQLLTRPRRIIWVIVLVMIAWVGWQGRQQLVDQPLDEQQVTARQLRVDQGQLQRFQAALATYQHPPAINPTTTPPFHPAE